MTRSEATAKPVDRATAKTLGSGTIADRLRALRATAATDAAIAQDEMWDWLQRLGRKRDGRALKTVFELGAPPRSLEGPADGILVTTLINPLVDLPIRLATKIWMPWRGKTFYPDTQTGINRLTADAVLPARFLWPFYRMRETPEGHAGFEFVSGIEPGKIEPRIPVLKIDYQPVSTNPAFIRQIRDELVELVPNTHLGRVLFRLPRERFTNIGYFALRQPTDGS